MDVALGLNFSIVDDVCLFVDDSADGRLEVLENDEYHASFRDIAVEKNIFMSKHGQNPPGEQRV